MPLYEYECEAENGRRFEIIQKFSDPALTVCPTCGGPVRKLISSPAIQFKGSGFYITDYAKKSGVDAGKESKSGSSGGDSSSGSNSSTSTPATTTPAASTTPAKKD
jgi:putative FmdB family regulatory protein